MVFRKTQNGCILLFIAVLLLFVSCNKQEKVWQFHIEEPGKEPPPATGADTIISVTAILNNDSFAALGRAEPPSGKLDLSFAAFNNDAYLHIILGADTPGVYTMGRNISAHTAVWYNADGVSYTSRATEDAGGMVEITEVDTTNHRLKGSFTLLLLSRTDDSRYEFKDGAFDILYNHGIMKIDSVMVTAGIDETVKTFALSSGSPAAPQPGCRFAFGDSLELDLAILKYQGSGKYDVQDKDKITLKLYDKKAGKVYDGSSGTINLIRYNYKEFMQLLIEDCILKTETGELKKISKGSVVIGN